jgi:hypothetical protein
MADVPVEILIAGFGAMGVALGMVWRHGQQQTEQVRADLKERIGALESALAAAMREIKELRHYERDRLFSIADQAHEREMVHRAWLKRMQKCADCPGVAADADTETLIRKNDP